MAVISDPPSETFRLSMLLNDRRYRSLTIQVIALMGFMLGVGWLMSNAAANLAALGKPLSFDFLWQTAGYDINQKFYPYTSQSFHWEAAFVGILNTLFLAILGCFTATVLGVIIGVLRLSNNWVVSKIMTIYIEMFRNVPVLLWIVFANAIFIETLPKIRDFKGDTPAATMSLGETVAFTNKGWYIPGPIFSPTIWLYAALLAAAFVGIFVFGRWARVRQERTGEILPTFWIKLAIFFVPAIVGYYLMGKPVTWDLPELGKFRFEGGLLVRNSLIALWIALSLYTAAFIAEIVRAGIMAVSKGQSEAAFALGLKPSWTMNLVILPQALRVIIPPLISNYLNLTKNTSLAIAVGYMDVTGTLGGITLNQTGREMECLLLLMLVYLIISLTISAIMNAYNERTKLRER